MPTATNPSIEQKLIDLETKFWDALVNQDTDAALELLTEPAAMVSAHGAMTFDHAAYRKMAEHGSQVLASYEFADIKVVLPNDTTGVLLYRVRQRIAQRENGHGQGQGHWQEMNDTSTWIKSTQGWRCCAHTETPVAGQAAAH